MKLINLVNKDNAIVDSYREQVSIFSGNPEMPEAMKKSISSADAR